jgi:hypothetical protein
MPRYQLHKDGDKILEKDTNSCIPIDEGNIDYQSYLEWVSQGNTPLPAEDLPIGIYWEELRCERDRLLKETDWVSNRALETGEPVPQEWIAYRQALRNLPQTTKDPRKVKWPQRPS